MTSSSLGIARYAVANPSVKTCIFLNQNFVVNFEISNTQRQNRYLCSVSLEASLCF